MNSVYIIYSCTKVCRVKYNNIIRRADCRFEAVAGGIHNVLVVTTQSEYSGFFPIVFGLFDITRICHK
jgi:hypothetical protein